MHFHGRTGALATAVVIGLAVLTPSSALAGHDLGIYKNEAHLDLSSDEGATSVKCQPGDHAIDGMWRVDHADQDDYVQPLDLIAGAVDVLQAAPTADDTYSFSFTKNAIGRVQVKVWVTCLADKTIGGSHTHSFTTSAGFVKSNGTTAALAIGNFETDTQTATGTGSTTVPVTTTIDTNKTGAGQAVDKNCPSGTLLVSPGFSAGTFMDTVPAATSPSPGMMRLFASNSTNTPTTNRDWVWKFENSALPSGYTVAITTYWRCLKIRVPAGPDKHKLVPKFRAKTFNPTGNKVSEAQLNCGDHYKAILAGFSIPRAITLANDLATADSLGQSGLFPASALASSHTAFNDVYYLGMDPRIKQRAYRFVNRGATGTWPIALSTLCINYRTT